MKKLTYNTYFFGLIEITKADNAFFGIAVLGRVALVLPFKALIL